MIDYHSHVLPGIDDGAASIEISNGMLQMLHEQGVTKLVATPHFYAHKEKSVDAFLEKRQAAFEKIVKNAPFPILLGAEVAIEHGISELKDINKLAIEGTNIILLELPYREYRHWMSEEIYNIASGYKLQIMLAHIHRYLRYYTKEQMHSILEMQAIFQLNNEAWGNLKEGGFVKKLIRQGYPVVFGSDCHDMSNRKPNWDFLMRKCKSEIIMDADNLLDKSI